MAEALATLGIVANIAQIIGFGLQLASVGTEIYNSVQGSRDEYRELEIIIADVGDNTKKIREALSHSSTISSRDEKAILQLATECEPLATKLLKILNDLKISKDARFRGLETVKQTIRGAAKRKDIQDLKRRLMDLDSHLKGKLHTLFNEKNQSDILLAIRSLDRRHEQMNIHAASYLESLRTDLIATLAQGSQSIAESVITLKHLVSKLDAFTSRASQMENEQRILQSLIFDSMKEREENIRNAHESTLDWIFQNSETRFRSWLNAGTGIYWVKGKAGSGKSTLMKYTSNHRQTHLRLQEWSTPQRLITASYFFWNSGLPMQKSQKGLMQSLLYQVLLASPELVPKLAEEHRLGEPWETKELFTALQAISRETQLSVKYCFFVDGLDEYEGNTDDIVNLLQELATSPNIKLCISSRPWNAFLDAFDNSEWTLTLERMTKADIETYVKDLLEENVAFQKLAIQDPRCHELVPQIADKAHGVWLWVFLVVRALLRDIKGEEEYLFLQRRLDSFPAELEDYFANILNRIDKIYLEETSRIFLTTVEAVRPLPLLGLQYLSIKKDTPQYAIAAEVSPVESEEALQTFHRWRKLLNSRCSDLLEVTVKETEPTFLKYQVDFLHRTVRDFLRDNYRNELRRRAGEQFNPTGSLCSILLALIKRLPLSKDFRLHLNQLFGLVDELVYYSREIELRNGSPNTSILYELDRACSIQASDLGAHWTNARDPPTPSTTFKEYGQCNLLAFAIQSRLYLFTQEYLDAHADALKGKRGRPYLDYALRPKRVTPESLPYQYQYQDTSIDVRTIRLLLSLGSDPNQKIYLYNGQTVWSLFLASCYANARTVPSHIKDAWSEAIELLIDNGADPHVQCENPIESEFKKVGKTARYKQDVLVETEPRILSVEQVLRRALEEHQASRLLRRMKEVAEQRRGPSSVLWRMLGWT